MRELEFLSECLSVWGQVLSNLWQKIEAFPFLCRRLSIYLLLTTSTVDQLADLYTKGVASYVQFDRNRKDSSN